MSEREQKRKPTESKEVTEETADELVSVHTSSSGEKLKAEMDDLLDEIDEVLEENAEEFVRNYVQKGGE